MSASKIKIAIKNYMSAYEDAQYASCMASKSKGKIKKEFEEDEYHAEYGMDLFANTIKQLNPSKYLINKYPIIEEIIDEHFF